MVHSLGCTLLLPFHKLSDMMWKRGWDDDDEDGCFSLCDLYRSALNNKSSKVLSLLPPMVTSTLESAYHSGIRVHSKILKISFEILINYLRCTVVNNERGNIKKPAFIVNSGCYFRTPMLLHFIHGTLQKWPSPQF